MRWIVPSLLLLAVAVWIGAELPATPPAADPQDHPWRRTEKGWEHIGRWTASTGHDACALHPMTVAAGEILASALALLALDRPSRGQSERKHARHFGPKRPNPRSKATSVAATTFTHSPPA
jgi:hypothetical protein